VNEVLNVQEKVYSDESISKKEFHTYSSHNQTFKPINEIRVTIQNQDLYVLPRESYLNFQGIFRKDSPNGLTIDKVTTFFKKICMANFLDAINYEINACEIDRTRFVGITISIIQ